MDLRKKMLWRVPVFCVLAGTAFFYLCIHVLLRFAMVTLPDGSITVDNTRALIIYGVLFVAALLVGGLIFFRGMTRRELFFSATIIVLFGLILMLIEVYTSPRGAAAVWIMYLTRPFEWSMFVPQLVFKFTDSLLLSAVAQVLCPYLFVLFGKKAA